MSTKKAIFISALLGTVVFIVLIESGIYSVKLGGGGGPWSSSAAYGGMSPESVTGCSFVETGSGYRVWIQDCQGKEQTVDVVIEVDDISTDGYHWLPLCKTMDCHYSGRAESTDSMIEITFEGELEDFTVVGLCSPFAARRIARQEVIEEIDRIVEHNLGLFNNPVQPASCTEGMAVTP